MMKKNFPIKKMVLYNQNDKLFSALKVKSNNEPNKHGEVTGST